MPAAAAIRARIVILASHAPPKKATEATTIFQGVPVLKPGNFLMKPKSHEI